MSCSMSPCMEQSNGPASLRLKDVVDKICRRCSFGVELQCISHAVAGFAWTEREAVQGAMAQPPQPRYHKGSTHAVASAVVPFLSGLSIACATNVSDVSAVWDARRRGQEVWTAEEDGLVIEAQVCCCGSVHPRSCPCVRIIRAFLHAKVYARVCICVSPVRIRMVRAHGRQRA